MLQFTTTIDDEKLTFTVIAEDDGNYRFATTFDEVKYEGVSFLKPVGPRGLDVVRKLIEYVADDISAEKLNRDITLTIPEPFSGEKLIVVLRAEDVSEVEGLRRRIKKLENDLARREEEERNKPVFTMETLRELSKYFDKLKVYVALKVDVFKDPRQFLNNIINGTKIVKFGKECDIYVDFQADYNENTRKIISDIITIIGISVDDNRTTLRLDSQQPPIFYNFSFKFTMLYDLWFDVDIATEIMETLKNVSINCDWLTRMNTNHASWVQVISKKI